jgi:hypothetical protein
MSENIVIKLIGNRNLVWYNLRTHRLVKADEILFLIMKKSLSEKNIIWHLMSRASVLLAISYFYEFSL